MSMTMTLVPLVIALGSTVSTASLAAMCREKGRNIRGIPTGFADRGLLVETLNEHGLNVLEKEEDHIVVRTAEGELYYDRENSGEQYILTARNVRNMEKLIDSLREFEEEYGRNVQAYTYNKVMESLEEHGLSLKQEEVLDDDSIVLTLTL